MKRLIVFAAVLSAAVPSFGAFSSRSRGTSAATFLTLGGGARAAGMGGAQTASAEGASSVVWNPALPASATGPEVELMHGDWFEGAGYEFGAAAIPVRDGMAVSASFQQFSAGDLDRRDDAGFADGTFEPGDRALGLGFAVSAAEYLLGATVKAVRSEIVDDAQTWAVDLGAVSPEENGRRWGLAVTNLGGRLKFDSKEENLPVVVAAGARQRIGRHSAAVDLKFPRDNRPFLAVGAEAVLPFGDGFSGCGRLGYSTRSGTDAGSLAGASVGAGLKGRWFSIDYAFAPFGDLGSIHLFSLAVRGGGNGR